LGSLVRRITWTSVLCLAPTLGAADLAAWRYSKTITIDTTSAGAAVSGDVKDYPLAVVLSPANFDFDQAREDGADVRFSDPGGALLPHALEHWDQAGRRAAFWVKLPLVKGNDGAQTIGLHWGNPQAADVSDSRAVFDAKQGFVGVWHLGEDGSAEEGGYKDATATEGHLTGVNLGAGARVEGRVGHALLLAHPKQQWLKLEGNKRRSFDLTTRVTFSIWARAHGYLNKGVGGKLAGYETLMAKGDNSWRLQKFGVRDWHKPPRELVEICVEQPPRGDLCVIGKANVVPGQWFHFAGVHDFPKVRLYENGMLAKEKTFDVNWVSGDHPVGIGNQSQFPEQGRYWDGVLDEARVMQVVKDEHWIKLEYESQREGSKLLRFGGSKERGR
jgi:hypothetical protein